MELDKIKTDAFTLIELLVVIAIIGILSGLIIVGMSSSTQSANIAKSQIFSNSLRNSLLINLIGEWKFDDSITPGKDTWSSNNCTINGTPSLYSGTNCIYGSCLNFNGTTDYLDCGNSAGVNFTNALTIEAWVKLNSLGRFHGIFGKGGNIWSNYSYGFRVLSGNQLEFAASSTGTSPIQLTGPTLSANSWYQVAVSFTRPTIKMYVNGIITNQWSWDNNLYQSSSNAGIGLYAFGTGLSYTLAGILDNVRIYNSGIPTSLIKAHYYADLNHLLAKGEINNQEYQNKLVGIN